MKGGGGGEEGAGGREIGQEEEVLNYWKGGLEELDVSVRLENNSAGM